MAIIIVEGPDSSGKTTFVKQLAGWIGDDVRVIKSPAGRTQKWIPSYDYWANETLSMAKKSGRLWILDRTPEISEAIYGPIMRGKSRLENPTSSLLTLRNPRIVTVMMNGQNLVGDHTDPTGKNITDALHTAICGGYKVIAHILGNKGAKIVAHDYKASPPQWVSHYIINSLSLDLEPMQPQKMTKYLKKGDKLLWT